MRFSSSFAGATAFRFREGAVECDVEGPRVAGIGLLEKNPDAKARDTHKAEFLTCLLVGLFSGQAQSAESASFATQVEEVARLNQSDETSNYEIERVLLSEPEFNKLATVGDGNVDKCLSYLLETRHTPLQRRIAILAAYKATLSEWIRFSNKILDMHDNRLVDTEEVKDTILPRWCFQLTRGIIFGCRAFAGYYGECSI